MIFTGFKRKSNQIFLGKKWSQLLEKTAIEKAANIKKVFVILDDVTLKDAMLKEIANTLVVDQKNVECIVFKQKINKENTDEDLISPKDFGWYGKIKSEHLKKRLTKKYDLLINYSKVDDLYSNLLLLHCNTSFNVGFKHLDGRFYDLVIDCKSHDFKSFNSELGKYLKILKKI